MKAYKITAKISALTGGNGWNYGNVETRSHKEFYHLSKENALKHIEDYINSVKKAHIYLCPTKCKDKDCMVWSAHKDFSSYEVKLEEIEIKESYG